MQKFLIVPFATSKNTQGMSYVIGIDVGGTNTDAVVVEIDDVAQQYKIVAARKAPSTANGVIIALKEVIPAVRELDRLVGVFVGTTQFVNAIVERSEHLSKVVMRFVQHARTHATHTLCIDFFFMNHHCLFIRD